MKSKFIAVFEIIFIMPSGRPFIFLSFYFNKEHGTSEFDKHVLAATSTIFSLEFTNYVICNTQLI